MGAIGFGIPQAITAELGRLNGATVFVETGTFMGGTTRWASTQFASVHTIERSEILYNNHSGELRALGNVTPHLGDSRHVLPQVVAGMGDQRAVYWLDGHWCGGVTAGEEDECPLLDELACVTHRPDDIILIDDARLFLHAPPKPHDAAQWPTVADIVNALPDHGLKSFVQILDDVIFIIPDKPALRASLTAYSQKRAQELWEEAQREAAGKSLGTYVRRALSKVKHSVTSK